MKFRSELITLAERKLDHFAKLSPKPVMLVAAGGLGDLVCCSALLDSIHRKHCSEEQQILLWWYGDQTLAWKVLRGFRRPLSILVGQTPRPVLLSIANNIYGMHVFDWRHVLAEYYGGSCLLSASWMEYYTHYPERIGDLAALGLHFEDVARLSGMLPEFTGYYVDTRPAYVPIDKPYITLHTSPGGLPDHKGIWWQADQLVELIKKDIGCPIVQVGGKTERPVEGTYDARGWEIPRAASLIGASAAFIGCDSGPMFIAHALKIPSVIFFGPTPVSWLAWEGNLNFQNTNASCYPCFYSEPDWKWVCKLAEPHCACMTHVEEVWPSIKVYLKEKLKNG